MTERVLLVDDDMVVRTALAQTLELADLRPMTAGSFIEAKDHIKREFDGVIVTDVAMPGKDGFALLRHARSVDPDLPVILLTGNADVPMAVKGMASGAFDFLEKPCEPEALVSVVRKALRTRSMILENRDLKRRVQEGDAAARLLFGASRQAEALRSRVRAVALASTEVLVVGAPGTGTSKVAEVIHMLSPRARDPFQKLAGLSLDPGRLTRASEARETGTLFIDEVAGLGPAAQYALLELLDASSGPRVIAGTYRDLETEVSEGRFLHDLFYKLDAVRVRIPSLKERSEDIPVLFRHYVALACEQAALPPPEITADVTDRLIAQEWPGNARALMNAAMRFAMGLSEGDVHEELGLAERMAQVERTYLVEALRRQGGNASEAARSLKLPRKTFYDKLARHDIRPEDYRI